MTSPVSNQCGACGAELEVGTTHVPAFTIPGEDAVCQVVTQVELDEYLAAHCTNCASAVVPPLMLFGLVAVALEHVAVGPGSCRVQDPLSPPQPYFIEIGPAGEPVFVATDAVLDGDA